MTRDQLQPGYVLHRRDYGDTSLLLDVYAAAAGRIALVAKGARRARRGGSSQAALLQPYQPLLLAWTGRGEVGTLTRAEPAGRPLPLAGDALYCGFYVNELLLRLVARHDADEIIFAAYQRALTELAGGGEADTPLRRFELTLLGQLGYRPPLDRDADTGRPIAADVRYVVEPERGPILDGMDHPDALSGATLLALEAGTRLPPGAAREARRLLRRLLAPHLGERPLQSRALFAARRRGGAKLSAPTPDPGAHTRLDPAPDSLQGV
ncbi:DNA repair protein RecO [Thiohalocapsa sp. ML1]|jgi:DNA repair protein RecO (recombination protein O)|uniref:DNA repair protein RecO n=1 Tax=Thiohalocapsa sp. ML1 TaxID=1431688 RepID=UPI000731FA08|nr:DNA repair protein RecO [Thiohalocapsa sp. ML1]